MRKSPHSRGLEPRLETFLCSLLFSDLQILFSLLLKYRTYLMARLVCESLIQTPSVDKFSTTQSYDAADEVNSRLIGLGLSVVAVIHVIMIAVATAYLPFPRAWKLDVFTVQADLKHERLFTGCSCGFRCIDKTPFSPLQCSFDLFIYHIYLRMFHCYFILVDWA